MRGVDGKTFNTELSRDTMKGAIRMRLTVRKLFKLVR